MCMVVYIGSDVPLQTWPFDPAEPAFHVTDVPAGYEAVKRHFSKPHVYYAGAYEGCGCGFQYGRAFERAQYVPEQVAAADACRAAVGAYVREALGAQASVEIYACWSGDEAEPPSARRVLKAASFPEGCFEREFLVVGDSSAG